MIKTNKVIAFLVGIISLLQIVFTNNTSKAVSIGDTSYLERAEKGYYTIQKWNGSDWIYVTYSITNYVDENGIKRIAYCVSPDLKGIGYISGEFEGYNVELKNLISDNKCWRVLINGYPYKTPDQLGVETDQDAYLATKMALYAMLRGDTEESIRSSYRAGEDSVAGQHKEDILRRGAKVINAICNLVNIGNNGTETMQYNNLLQVKKVGRFEEDLSDKSFYSQRVKVDSSVECSEYFIKNVNNFPNGTKIVNSKGEEQTIFKGGEEFKIMVPKSSIIENISGTIDISGTCKNHPIYYAECTHGNYQNYVLCCDSYSKNIEASGSVDIEIAKSKLKIKKVDKDTGLPIANVKFSIKYKDGTNIGTYTTDEKGWIYLENLHQGQVVVKELETSSKYELDTKDYEITLAYNDAKELTIENEIKKANINIIKVDADNNKIKIEGAKFEIYNDLEELITTVVTDKNGEAKIEKLPINHKYTIKEVETAKEYILSDEPVTVELKENEIKTITFKNKKKIEEQPEEKEEVKPEEKRAVETEKKLPRTGLIDINKYLLTISGIGIVIKKLI